MKPLQAITLSVALSIFSLGEKARAVPSTCSQEIITTFSHISTHHHTDEILGCLTGCDYEDSIKTLQWIPGEGARLHILTPQGTRETLSITESGIYYQGKQYVLQIKKGFRRNVSIKDMRVEGEMVIITAEASGLSGSDSVKITDLCSLLGGVVAGEDSIQTHNNSKTKLVLQEE